MQLYNLHWAKDQLSKYEAPLARIGQAWLSNESRYASAIGPLQRSLNYVAPRTPTDFGQWLNQNIMVIEPCAECGIRNKVLFLHPQNMPHIPNVLFSQVLVVPIDTIPCEVSLGLLMRHTPLGELAFANYEVRSIIRLQEKLITNGKESLLMTEDGQRLSSCFTSQEDRLLLGMWSTAISRCGREFIRELTTHCKLRTNWGLSAILKKTVKSLMRCALSKTPPQDERAWPAQQRRVREIKVLSALSGMLQDPDKTLSQVYALIHRAKCH